MTKVKTTTSRKQGNSTVPGKEQKALSQRKMITAERNGHVRNFTSNVWDNLPEDKEGWKETSPKPADLTADNGGSTTITPEQARKDAGAKYKEVFGKYPARELTTDEVLKLISDKEGNGNGGKADEDPEMVDFTIDQEYLDLNPDAAVEGKKVGDVIKVKKGEIE